MYELCHHYFLNRRFKSNDKSNTGQLYIQHFSGFVGDFERNSCYSSWKFIGI